MSAVKRCQEVSWTGLSAALPGQVAVLSQVAVISLTVRLLLCRAIAAENSKKEVQRTLLGTVQPGDSIPVPYGWQKAGMLFLLQLMLTAQTRVQQCAVTLE